LYPSFCATAAATAAAELERGPAGGLSRRGREYEGEGADIGRPCLSALRRPMRPRGPVYA
jgi:hypothetical protein